MDESNLKDFECNDSKRNPSNQDVKWSGGHKNLQFHSDHPFPIFYKSSPPNPPFPQFTIDADQVTVLFSPKEFHRCLVDLYSSAERRIILAALYIGTGGPEAQVIESISESCRRVLFPKHRNTEEEVYSDDITRPSTQGSTPSTRSSSEIAMTTTLSRTHSPPTHKNESKLTVDILMDSARGRRVENGGSSLTMLEPLFELKKLSENQHLMKEDDLMTASPTYQSYRSSKQPNSDGVSELSINVNLFHCPLLSGFLYQVLPPRINEVLGVFHTKIFLVDDAVVLTGANLSGSYLTNRQDRYIVIRNAPVLTDFLHQLTRLIQKFSFSVELETNPSRETQQQQEKPMTARKGRWWKEAVWHDDHRVILNDEETLLLTVDPDIPHPVISATEFRYKFGQALHQFLIQHCPPSPQTPLTSTVLHVLLQAGFCNPPLQQEQNLLSFILSTHDPSHVPLLRDRCRRFINRSSLSSLCPSRRKSTTSQYSLVPEVSERTESQAGPTGMGITSLGNSFGRIILASGYLNMSDDLLEELTRAIDESGGSTSSKSFLEVFTAAPEANSFHQSQGLSKYIPMAYSYVGATQLLRLRHLWEQRRGEDSSHLRRSRNGWLPFRLSSLWSSLDHSGLERNIECRHPPVFWEYDRASWTFHSKGVWFYPKSKRHDSLAFGDSIGSDEEENPIATIVGSSNYGLRSRVRDLDMSFLIQTKDSRLQQQFHREVEKMRHHSKEVSDVSFLVTRCPRWLRFLLRWAGIKTLL